MKLCKAVSEKWFKSKEAKERKKKIEESSKILSDSMKASLVVSESLLKSRITI